MGFRRSAAKDFKILVPGGNLPATEESVSNYPYEIMSFAPKSAI